MGDELTGAAAPRLGVVRMAYSAGDGPGNTQLGPGRPHAYD
jgi:hypothetical protein